MSVLWATSNFRASYLFGLRIAGELGPVLPGAALRHSHFSPLCNRPEHFTGRRGSLASFPAEGCLSFLGSSRHLPVVYRWLRPAWLPPPCLTTPTAPGPAPHLTVSDPCVYNAVSSLLSPDCSLSYVLHLFPCLFFAAWSCVVSLTCEQTGGMAMSGSLSPEPSITSAPVSVLFMCVYFKKLTSNSPR